MATEHVRFQCTDGDTHDLVGDSESETHRRNVAEAEAQARKGCFHRKAKADGRTHDSQGRPFLCGKPMRRVEVTSAPEVGHEPAGAA